MQVGGQPVLGNEHHQERHQAGRCPALVVRTATTEPSHCFQVELHRHGVVAAVSANADRFAAQCAQSGSQALELVVGQQILQ